MNTNSTMRNLALITLVLLRSLGGSAQVVINEVSPSNYSDHADGAGEYEDWIELYNTGGSAVDLTGWYLSDSQNNNTKWAFPAGASIGANAFMVVYCDGRNTTVGAEHHTSFKLNQTSAEWAVLSDPSAAIVSDYEMTLRTQMNHSRGLDVDGTGSWALFLNPTPGASNVGAVPEYAPRPQFGTPSGVHAGPVTLALSAPAGNTIRYTLDGTTPTATATTYSGPIAINTTTVVRARCFSTTANVPPSAIETHTYLIGAGHTVPIISLAGDDILTLLNGTQNEPIGSLEYFGPDGQLRSSSTGDMNEHGNDSWAYDQRGIDYVSRDQFGDNDALHYPIFRTKTRDQYQRLILKAGASDNYPFENGGAHIRDAFVQALSQLSDLKLDERSYEPCVLYANGNYWGVYEIREKVDDADFTDEYYDQPADQLHFLKTWGATWAEYGGNAAENDWDAVRDHILSNDMGDAAAFAAMESQYNWKSLVDYVVLNSQTVCADWLNWNTAWWRGLNPDGDGRRWRYTLWDMDATFGHYTNFTNIPDQTAAADPCNPEFLPDPGGQGHIPILEKLMNESETFRNYYINRYIDLNNTVFTCDHMIGLLDSLVALIEPEMPGHIARWGGSMGEWQGNVQAIRDFITDRCVLITEGLQDCYDVEGPYPVVFNVDPPLSGEIAINSLQPSVYPFSGQYYGGINTNLAPVPANGYIFSHWEVFSTNTILPSTTDSLVTIDILTADSIVAHFVPPVRYDVVLDVEPRVEQAAILFDGVTYTDFPATVSVPKDTEVSFTIAPPMYYDFRYWTLAHNTPIPNDSSLVTLSTVVSGPDTIVAHLLAQEHAFYVPNSFSPNGDGINDTFRPIARVVEVKSYDLRIFDRWGLPIHTSTDPDAGWDGTFGGTAVPVGVYAYRAYAVDAVKQEVHEIHGHVTVVR